MADTRDFYMRTESDPNFVPDQIEVYDEIESCVNQVRMTLLTNKGEVLGEPDFGLEVTKYLFDFEIDPFNLADGANAQIQKYVSESRKRKVTAKPSYVTDEKERKTYILQIAIDGRRSPFAVMYN